MLPIIGLNPPDELTNDHEDTPTVRSNAPDTPAFTQSLKQSYDSIG